MGNIISKSVKVFDVELKKKIRSIVETKHMSSSYTLIFYVTNAKMVFSMLHDFNLEEFIPEITEQIQRLFYFRNLKFENYSEYFHFDQNLWPECCHPYNTEFRICKDNFEGREWSRSDNRVIKSFVFSL